MKTCKMNNPLPVLIFWKVVNLIVYQYDACRSINCLDLTNLLKLKHILQNVLTQFSNMTLTQTG